MKKNIRVNATVTLIICLKLAREKLFRTLLVDEQWRKLKSPFTQSDEPFL